MGTGMEILFPCNLWITGAESTQPRVFPMDSLQMETGGIKVVFFLVLFKYA